MVGNPTAPLLALSALTLRVAIATPRDDDVVAERPPSSPADGGRRWGAAGGGRRRGRRLRRPGGGSDGIGVEEEYDDGRRRRRRRTAGDGPPCVWHPSVSSGGKCVYSGEYPAAWENPDWRHMYLFNTHAECCAGAFQQSDCGREVLCATAKPTMQPTVKLWVRGAARGFRMACIVRARRGVAKCMARATFTLGPKLLWHQGVASGRMSRLSCNSAFSFVCNTQTSWRAIPTNSLCF